MPNHTFDVFIGKKVSFETLIGRNYYHYTNGIEDAVQKLSYSFPDFILYGVDDVEDEQETGDDEENEIEDKNESDEMEDDDDDEEDEIEDDSESEDYEDEEGESLYDYIPTDCWVKRFATTEDETCDETYLILVVTFDESMVINKISIIMEFVRRPGLGLFTLPGVESKGISAYLETDYVPERIVEDLLKLIQQKYLPHEYSFIGKRLPQAMIEDGGNGGSCNEYTYALQSAYRQAYTHMSVGTSSEGVIEGLELSSYQSSGSGWGNMFSRPKQIGDRKNEAIHVLLQIVDLYSDEEYAENMKAQK